VLGQAVQEDCLAIEDRTDSVTDQGSTFESRTVWVSVGYVTELRSRAKKRTCVKQSYSASLMFAVIVLRSNLIRSKESETARKVRCTAVNTGCRLAVNGRAC
jgi:hypothetical protein